MAAIYGRFIGKTGVCRSTLGPGATTLVTAGVQVIDCPVGYSESDRILQP